MNFHASILQSIYELSIVTHKGMTYWGAKFNFSKYGQPDELWLFSMSDGVCRCKHRVDQELPYYLDVEGG